MIALCSHALAAMRRAPIEPRANCEAPIWAEPIIALYRRWIDVEKLAGLTAHIALAGLIATLQGLTKQAQGLPAAPCTVDAQKSHERSKLIRAFEADLGSARCKA